ncbi:MAG: iron-sulfur cluster assembly scaffold protein, partial [Pseudomonadota bacterium]|nr:iron-sulfur cluster assembly scaffold protein [Pseudomonadota bacterium]
AASSVMARNIIGSGSEELLEVKKEMYNMLKEDGTPPSGKWDDLKYFEPVRDFKGRHASVLLVFDAVENCINELK